MAGLHFPFFLCAALSLLLSSNVQALKLEMIHRDSIHSPLYLGNLTTEQQLQSLSNCLSKEEGVHSFSYENVSHAHAAEQQFRAPLYTTRTEAYFVKQYIGSPPQGPYYLTVDTGSDITWVKCGQQFFNSGRSTSFSPIPDTSPLCPQNRPGVDRWCHYTIRYSSGQSSSGELANESFHFSGGTQPVRLAFGCSRTNPGFERREMSGMLGLNRGALSLLQQTGSTRFAYCLQRSLTKPSILRIGQDARLMQPGVRTVPFVPVVGRSSYYLPLVDVSVADKHVGFERGVFDVRPGGNGGFIIDSGTCAIKFEAGSIYGRIIAKFKDYFSRYPLEEVKIGNLDLCYQDLHGNFRAFPSMTLHFSNGVDLVVQPDNLVHYLQSTLFCMVVAPAIGPRSILGAYPQHNYRFLYDLHVNQLSFVPADCSQDE